MLKKIILLLLALAWIGLTFYRPLGMFQSVGALITYSTGLFHLEPADDFAGPLQLKAPEKYQVDIYVDTIGIPHIYGKDANSAAFGLGYMHARDRGFQMELITRTVQGRLSELLGRKVVASDKFWKPLEMEKKAQNTLEELRLEHPRVYSDMISYAEGVNFYFNNEEQNHKAPEYNLLGTAPRPWEPHYSLLLSGYMSYMLAYDDQKKNRQKVLENLPKDLRTALFEQNDFSGCIIPDTVFDCINKQDTTGEWNILKTALNAPVISIEEELYRQSIGSNNWALGGLKTESGKAILCNDTHLDISLPSPWYEAHLAVPGFNVYGFSIPCSPYIISGHNESIAWGMTNAYWDVTDLYTLKLHPENPNRYWFEGEWKGMVEKEYVIKVKGANPEILKVLYTELGAVIRNQKEAYVQRWYPAEENNTSVVTFKLLTEAKNWMDFNNAMSHYSYPAQNFVFADVRNNIGMLCAGKLPLRPSGFQGGVQDGSKAYPAEFIPFEYLPKNLNPKRSFVASANQIPATTTYYVGYSYADFYRSERINEVLNENKLFSIKDMQMLQADKTDIAFRDLKALLTVHYDEDSEDWKLIKPLISWNGKIDPDQYEPLLYHYLSYFIRFNFSEILQKKYKVSKNPPLSKLLAFLSRSSQFEVKDTLISTNAFLVHAIKDAREMLKKDFGEHYTEKGYNHFTQFRIPHILKIPGWGEVVQDAGGNAYTPNVNSGGAGPSMRTVIELGKKKINSFTVVAGGQSGRPNSRNYKNQLKSWKDIGYKQAQLTKDPGQLQNIYHSIHINSK